MVHCAYLYDDPPSEEDEEFVEEYVIPTTAGNIAALRQFCVNTLGKCNMVIIVIRVLVFA